jgi:methionyl-tRNA formyltransferase
VKARAAALGLTVLQPARIDREASEAILALRPDALVWAAYGNRIPGSLIAAVGGRALNVHASLLPRWRGAAPVAHAILAGDERTGVTLMQGTAGLDRGPIVASEAVAIAPEETAGELTLRLAALGGVLLERELGAYLDGRTPPRPQDEAAATWAPKLTAADGELRLDEPAEAVVRRVRAMTPAPGAWTTFRGQRLVVLRAAVTGGRGVAHGSLELRDGLPHVAAGAGWLRLEALKPAGKRAMSGADWARGLRDLGPDARLPS